MTKVLKLKVVKPTQIKWQLFGKIINDMDFEAHKIKNKAMTRYYNLWRNEVDHNFEYPYDKFNSERRKALYGYSNYASLIYNEMKEEYGNLGFHSEVIPGLIKETINVHNKVAKDMLKGNAVLPTFKRGQPIPVRSRQIKMTGRNTFSLALINKRVIGK